MIPGRSGPLVVCVMLANGRPEMVKRAVRSFEAQSYPNRLLQIYDTGEKQSYFGCEYPVNYCYCYPGRPVSIGQLRNEANALAVQGGAGIIVHFDSDDWSSPDRLRDQLTLLVASGAEAVGYHEMLFWKTCNEPIWRMGETEAREIRDVLSEAWLYSSPNPNTCLGTSLMYWAKVWQANPFPDKHTAEDHLWCLKRKVSAVSAGVHQPRMIASIHGANTCSKITPGAREWKRALGSDATCRRLMEL